MYYTISGFYNTYKDRLNLICGGGGMTRRIRSAGVLDYEFLPELRGKYRHSNFQEDQLVITTFLYARDNEFLIADAVKNLIAKGVSGLIIKNVFHLQIHETVVRYADAKNFPIFVSDSADLIFEDFIFDVMGSVRRMESLDFVQKEIDATLANETTEEEAYNHGINLNPSFENQHQVFYLPVDVDAPDFSYLNRFQSFQDNPLNRPEDLLTFYDGGFLYIHSWEHQDPVAVRTLAEELKKNCPEAVCMGISEVHYYLGELKRSLKEAIYAARVASHGNVVRYGELGSLQILLPHCRSNAMESFRRSILEPLAEYDLENKAHLQETLEAYCENGFRFSDAAAALSQHENTVRYRMEKIAEVTGLHYKSPQELQQLDLAYRIQLCQEILEKE